MHLYAVGMQAIDSQYAICRQSICYLYAVCMLSVCSLYAILDNYMQSVWNLYAVCMQSVCSLYAICKLRSGISKQQKQKRRGRRGVDRAIPAVRRETGVSRRSAGEPQGACQSGSFFFKRRKIKKTSTNLRIAERGEEASGNASLALGRATEFRGTDHWWHLDPGECILTLGRVHLGFLFERESTSIVNPSFSLGPGRKTRNINFSKVLKSRLPQIPQKIKI